MRVVVAAEAAGHSVEWIADNLGVSASTVDKWRRGVGLRVQRRTAREIRRLAKRFTITLDDPLSALPDVTT